MEWLSAMIALLSSNWQVMVPALLVVALIIWAVMKYGVQKPKIASMIKIILEVTQGWLADLLGPKFGPVYNAIISAATAVVDGNFTKEEALDLANKVFESALSLTGTTLTEEEKASVDKVLEIIIDTIMRDKASAKIAIKSL